MRKGFLSSIVVLLAGTGWACAQAPAPPADSNPVGTRVVIVSPPPGGSTASVVMQNGGHAVAAPHGEPCLTPEPPCGPPGKCWVGVEYLLWRIKEYDVPPLVTTGPITDFNPALGIFPGTLGLPGTVVLFGGDVDEDWRHGLRVSAGTWFGCDQRCGIEANYFVLEDDGDDFTVISAGSPILTRPLVDALTGAETVEFVAFPGLLSGSVDISSSSQLQGGEVNFIKNLCCCPCSHRVDLLAGFRYMELEDELTITETITTLAPLPPTIVIPGVAVPVPAGTSLTVVDRFETENRFYGGQIGARAEFWRGRVFANVTGKLAIGSTHQIVRISGSTTVTAPGGAPLVFPGGQLALPTNIGTHDRDEFSILPEIGFNVGYQLTDSLRAYAGYSLLYWSDVVRPGDHIDRTINASQQFGGVLVGPARPAFSFNETDFWAHGFNLGVELRF